MDNSDKNDHKKPGTSSRQKIVSVPNIAIGYSIVLSNALSSS